MEGVVGWVFGRSPLLGRSSRGLARLKGAPARARTNAEHATPAGGIRRALLEKIDKLRAESDLLRARLRRLDPHRRPYFRPWERLEILAHRLRHGMSVEAAAKAFVLARQSVVNWIRDANRDVVRLVQALEPVNKLPDVVRELSWFLKREWPR